MVRAYPPPEQSPPRHQRGSQIITLLMLLLMAAVLYQFSLANRRPLFDPGAEKRAVTPRGDLAEAERTTIDVFRAASPSVVNVSPARRVAVRRGFSFNVLKIPSGSGSGFIWDMDGHIVTNEHVIDRADDYLVTLADRSVWDARLVGSAPGKDLAVLKIDVDDPARRLRPLAIGTSTGLAVGQSVFAIGNPFGLDQSLSTGVISGLGREINTEDRPEQGVPSRPIQGAIQTDAAINPGNSGGPLLDSAGLMIGVNTSIVSPSGAYAGIGFAIPSDTVNDIVTQLIRFGTITRPGFGIMIDSDRNAQLLGMDGVLVTRVLPDSAAEAAGFIAFEVAEDGRTTFGDLIVAVEGEAVHTQRDLYKILDLHKIGDQVTVTLSRLGERRDVSIRLQSIDP